MRFYHKIAFFSVVLIFSGKTDISSAQESISDLKKEIEILKEGQQAIRNDLQEIKALLTSKAQLPTPPPAVSVKGREFDLGNNPIRGDSRTKLTMISFTDYQCPYCSKFARETLPQIIKQYVDNGKIRFAVINLPLPIHEFASKAAEASLCAKEQGKFWEMHDQMMSNQNSLKDLSSYALSIGLDSDKFADCLKSNKYAKEISAGFSVATGLRISGVPTFILAESNFNEPSKVKAITLLKGAMPFDVFQKEIDEALAKLNLK
jgi:protein-disulfide isomerase